MRFSRFSRWTALWIVTFVTFVCAVAWSGPGNLGTPSVITWADTAGTSGVAWGTTASIVAGNAYVTYNATDMLLNVPTGDSFSFLVNNVEVVEFTTAGGATLGSSLNFVDGDVAIFQSATDDMNFRTDGATSLTISGGASPTIIAPGAGTVTVEGWTFTGSQLSASQPLGAQYFFDAAAATARLTPSGTTWTLLAGNSLQLGDSNVAIAESGTNDLSLTSDGAVSATLSGGATANLLLAGVATIQLGDSNVSVSETGTNVLLLTGAAVALSANNLRNGAVGNMSFQDSAGNQMALIEDTADTSNSGRLYITSIYLPDGQITLTESGTDDLAFTTDAAVSAVLSGGGTANLLLQGVATLQFGDSAVSISENATNDLAFAADSAQRMLLSDAGLTMSAGGAINASLGSGSAAPLVGGTLNLNNTAVGNVDAGPDDLMTYALPANSMVVNARGVHIKAWGTAANNANAKTLTCYFGTQAILTNSFTISLAETWEVEAWVSRTALSAQDWRATFLGNTGAAGAFVYDPELGTATQTETGAITIKCEATTVTTTNDIVQEGMIVEAL